MMRAILCNVEVNMPVRSVFSRKRAANHANGVGKYHLDSPCVHVSCKKTRAFIARKIVYTDEQGKFVYVRIGKAAEPIAAPGVFSEVGN